jgi:serine/threonine protein kinase/tetratricopeptide (TPR) repeat protein
MRVCNDELMGRLTQEMADRWAKGERPLAEEFLDRHPQLRLRPEIAIDLVYEELCLREEYGEPIAPQALYGRFPSWQKTIELMVDFHQHREPIAEEPTFPEVGETFGEYELIAELGSGAEGRVYLATQPSLADRHVVLKLSPRTGKEHLSLARLQHTHIVPLYAIHDDPRRGLRALCMPYFGSATLARLQEVMNELPRDQRDGQQLLAALDQVQAVPLPPPARSPGRHLLARASYVQALCWITAGLAEGLHYAHEHGLVHLDVKPSNVLLATAGQPMLLDFHLAQPPLRPDGDQPEWLGGTLAYMAPEHWEALSAIREGKSIPRPVDSRADLFALGAMLYEALGGKLPVQADQFRPLRRINPEVSHGLSDVVRKCLAADPRDRYPNGRALATDLVRHLDNLPLLGVRNRSLVELWAKWRRRKPAGVAWVAAGLLATGLSLGGGYHWLHRFDQRREQAAALLEGGRQSLDRGDLAAAEAALHQGLAWAEVLPDAAPLVEEFHGALRKARQQQAVRELHRLADVIRFLFPSRDLTGPAARDLAARCRGLWDLRDRVLEKLGPDLAAVERRRIETDLLDLAILTADLSAESALPAEQPASRQESLRTLADAEKLFGPSPVLAHERRRHARALGAADPAADKPSRAPATAWEHYALGRSYLQAGDLTGAADHLAEAVRLQPQGLWPNFYQAQCAYRQGKYSDAAFAFSVCIGAAPEKAPCYFNRALACTALGLKEQAVRDYDQALRLEPTLGVAYLNRGALHVGAGRLDEAEADLRKALEDGADPASVHFNLALVHVARKDRTAALESVREALRHNPRHSEARELLDRLSDGRTKVITN